MRGLVPAAAVFAGATAVARSRRVHGLEQQAFRTVNELPHALYVPVYLAMQSGSLAAVFVAAGVARAGGRSRLAGALAATGTAVWAGAKGVKRWVGRGRPADHLDGVRVRGSEEGGLGFPSGHTAVAVCLATTATPALPPGARVPVWAAAATVGVARVYVGAHLPLDVVGGAALGVLAGAAGRVAIGGSRLRRGGVAGGDGVGLVAPAPPRRRHAARTPAA